MTKSNSFLVRELMTQEATIQSREEDEELERSTKKVKENHSHGTTSHPTSPRTDGRGVMEIKAPFRRISFKYQLG